jgi:hypothetical protein
MRIIPIQTFNLDFTESPSHRYPGLTWKIPMLIPRLPAPAPGFCALLSWHTGVPPYNEIGLKQDAEPMQNGLTNRTPCGHSRLNKQILSRHSIGARLALAPTRAGFGSGCSGRSCGRGRRRGWRVVVVFVGDVFDGAEVTCARASNAMK